MRLNARRLTPMLGALLVSLTGAATAHAQLFSSRAPVDISAAHQEVNAAGSSMTYSGAVELLQEGRRLRADRLTVTFGRGTGSAGGLGLGDVSRIEASGNVFYVTPQQTLRGDNAVYEASSDTLVMTGRVIITSGQNVITAARVTYHPGSGVAVLEPGGGGKVRTIFYPKPGSRS